MAKRYETYAYIDLEALTNARTDGGESADAGKPVVGAESSCRGKTLLLLSATGLEIVHVPTLLH